MSSPLDWILRHALAWGVYKYHDLCLVPIGQNLCINFSLYRERQYYPVQLLTSIIANRQTAPDFLQLPQCHFVEHFQYYWSTSSGFGVKYCAFSWPLQGRRTINLFLNNYMVAGLTNICILFPIQTSHTIFDEGSRSWGARYQSSCLMVKFLSKALDHRRRLNLGQHRPL